MFNEEINMTMSIENKYLKKTEKVDMFSNLTFDLKKPLDYRINDLNVNQTKSLDYTNCQGEPQRLVQKLRDMVERIKTAPESEYLIENSVSEARKEHSDVSKIHIADILETFEPMQQTLMLYYLEVYKSLFTSTSSMTSELCSLLWDMTMAKKEDLYAQANAVLAGAGLSAVVSVGGSVVGVAKGNTKIGRIISQNGMMLAQSVKDTMNSFQIKSQAAAAVDDTQVQMAQTMVQTSQQQQQQNISSKEEALQVLQAIIRTIIDADSAITASIRT